MKIAKSIRWQLQIWYGLILVAVLTGFGITAYQLDSGREFSRVDDDLHRHFAAVFDAMHTHRPPPGERPPLEGRPPDQFPPDAPPPDDSPHDHMDRQNFSPLKDLELPPRAALLFETNQAGGGSDFFLLVRGRDGKTITARGSIPDHLVIPTLPPAPNDHSGPPSPIVTVSGHYRLLSTKLPGAETIVIGCSILAEAKEMHQAAVVLTLVGLGILVFGLAGGWWMVSRAIQPIADISRTAVKISGGDLSQRINVAATGSELGQLAAVLNSTFARLETAFAQQQQFTADAAHELRTPLSILRTRLETLEDRRVVSALLQDIEAMSRIVGQLLDIAELDAFAIDPLDVADAREVCSEVAEFIAPLALEQEREIALLAVSAPVWVRGNAEMMKRAIRNLAENALKHTPPGTLVEFVVDEDGTVSVRDRGPGISDAERELIFRRFWRRDRSQPGSTGLGLPIVQRIAELHGATISVANRATGGARFSIHFAAATGRRTSSSVNPDHSDRLRQP